MALEASSLQVVVSGAGIVETTKALLDLAAAGDKAEQSSTKLAKTSQDSSKAQVDAAQEAASKFNAIIDMMTEKASTFYSDKALKAAQASQQELFEGMSMMDKLYAYADQTRQVEAAARAKQTADVLAQQQKQMDAAIARYAAEQELANSMNAIYDKRKASSLEDDHAAAIIENQARAWKALGQAQAEALAINARMDAASKELRADADAFVASLKRQAETVGLTTKELREYTAEQQRAKAAQLGVTQQVDGYIQSIKNAKGPHESFNLLTAGSARELMVLGHELSQGQFQRFGGSLIVLGERINFLPSLLEKAAAAAASLGMSLGLFVTVIAAAVAAVATFILAISKGAAEQRAFNNALILTGNFAGTTGDNLNQMAKDVGVAAGSIGDAKKVVLELANSGKFTAEQIGFIAPAIAEVAHVTGKSGTEMAKQFEQIATMAITSSKRSTDVISQHVLKLNDQYHFLTASQFEHISMLEKEGNAQEAANEAEKAYANALKERAEEIKSNLGTIQTVWMNIKETAGEAWDAMLGIGKKSTAQDIIDNYKSMLEHMDNQPGWISGNGTSWGQKSFDESRLRIVQALTAAVIEKNNADAKAIQQGKDQQTQQEGMHAIARTIAVERQVSKQSALELALAEEKTNNALAKQAIALDKASGNWERMEAAKKAEAMYTDEAIAKRNKDITDYYSKKQPKPKSEGLAGVNNEIAEINEVYDVQKHAMDNQIKLIDFKKQYGLMSEEDAQSQKAAMLDQELVLEKEHLQKAIDAIDNFHTKDVRLALDAATKKSNLQKQLNKINDDIALKQQENALVPDIAYAAAMQKAQDDADRTLKVIERQTKEVQAQVDAYNNLPESVKAAGISQKQMASEIEQAKIDTLQAERDSLKTNDLLEQAMNSTRIRQIDAEIEARKKLKEVDQNREANEKRNSEAINLPAAMRAQAAEQVKLWKDAGNEIQKSLTQAFGAAGKAAGEMFKAFSEGQANQIDLSEKIAEAKLRESRTGIDETKTITALQNQQEQNQLVMYANMANGASEFFDKQSKGYRIMQSVSQAYHLAEMAQALASIPVKLAAGAATMFEQGGFAGFAGVAAMTALVAGFGVAISGGSGANVAAKQQAQQGTGSVLGDSKAKSDSIAKSISILEKNSGLGLAQGDTMLGYMKNVSDNISNFAAMVVKATGINGVTPANTSTPLGGKLGLGLGAIAGGVGGAAVGTNIGMAVGSIGGPLGMAIGAVLGTIVGGVVAKLGGTKTSINDQGITAGPMSLADIQKNGLNASSYMDVHTSSFWGLSQSNKTTTQALSADVNKQFSLVITSLADTVKAAATALGVCGDDFSKKLEGFVVDIGNISTKGLSGDEAQKQIAAVFSKVGDDMAQYGLSGFEKFQKVGEGYLETISRVANDFLQVKDVFAVLGKSLNAVGVDAANVSEGLITAAGGLDNLTKGTKTFVTGFLTNAQQIAPIAKSVNDQLATMGLSWVQTREQFAQVVQGLDLTTEAGQNEYASLINLADAFAKTHAAIQDTTLTVQQIADQRKSLMDELNSLTLTNVQLLQQQRAAIDQSNLALYDQVQTMKSMQSDSSAGLSNVDDAFSVLQDMVNAQKASLQNAFKLEQKQIQDKIDLETTANQKLKTLASNLQSALDSMKPAVIAQDVSKAIRMQAQQQLRDALILFRSGGTPDADSLKNPLSIATSDATSMFSNAVDYQRDFYRTQNTISDLAKYGNAAASTSDKILKTLNDQKDASQASFDSANQSLDDTVKFAQEQIKQLKGQSASLLSIDQAMKGLALALAGASANPLTSGTAAVNQTYQTALGRAPDAAGLAYWQQQILKGTSITDIQSAISNSSEAQIQTLYKNLLGRDVDPAGLNFWNKAMSSGMDISAVAQAIRSSPEYTSKLPSFDVGINNVPYDMTAKIHAGERIMPKADNLELMQRLKSPQANAEALSNEVVNLREEIASLKETIRTGDVANVQQTKEVVKYLKRWDTDGQPEVRNVDN
jgi:hypothetical protein